MTDNKNDQLVAYLVAERFFPEDELERYRNYGIDLVDYVDCRIAPVVADAYQGCGIGTVMMRMIVEDLWSRGLRKIVLFGGTQATNEVAKRAYEKVGFKAVGYFEHKSIENIDMYIER